MNTYIDSDGNRLSYNNIDMEKCEYLIVLALHWFICKYEQNMIL